VSTTRACFFAVVAAWAAPVEAQPAAPVGAARERLALAYLRVEAAWRDHPPTGAAIAAANRAFDASTLAFFGGRFAEATAQIDSLARSLDPSPARWDALGDSLARVLTAMPGKGERLTVDGVEVPYRTLLPPGSAPAPVILALHGAGGDEHMFLDAYGAGRLRALAAAQGAIVISPGTNAVLRAPGAFAALIDAVARVRPIDRSRIVVIGHSLGAGAAWRLALQQRGRIAAVACIAGGCGTLPPGTTADSLPPLLLVAGALDPIANADRLEQASSAARAAGVTVTFERRAHYGHTLLVGDALPEVVRWLFASRPR
jgi:predicted esterase